MQVEMVMIMWKTRQMAAIGGDLLHGSAQGSNTVMMLAYRTSSCQRLRRCFQQDTKKQKDLNDVCNETNYDTQHRNGGGKTLLLIESFAQNLPFLPFILEKKIQKVCSVVSKCYLDKLGISCMLKTMSFSITPCWWLSDEHTEVDLDIPKISCFVVTAESTTCSARISQKKKKRQKKTWAHSKFFLKNCQKWESPSCLTSYDFGASSSCWLYYWVTRDSGRTETDHLQHCGSLMFAACRL